MPHCNQTHTKIRHHLLLMALGISLLGGCEKMENAGRVADKRVDTDLRQAAVDAQGFGVKAEQEAAADVKKAAEVSDASDAGKARATSALSRSEYEQALALWPMVQDNSTKVQQALWDLRTAAMEIQRIELSSGFYQQLDPKDAIAKLDEIRTATQQTADKVKTDLTSLQADLTKRQQEIADLTAQRQKLSAQAADLGKKSEEAKGQQALDLFKQSADLAMQSGQLASQIDTKNAQLMPVQHQIAMDQQQLDLLSGNNGSIPQLDAQKTQLSAAWESSQQHSQEIRGDVKKMLDDVVTPNSDKSNAGGKLQTIVADNDKKSAQVEQLLKDAITHADAAAKAASNFHRGLAQQLTALKPNSPEAGPLKMTMAAYDEQQYQLLKGNAQLALANFYAGRAIMAADRKRTLDGLAAALQASGQQIPGDLPNVDAEALKSDADKAYAAAEDTLQKVSGSGGNVEGEKVIRDGGLASLIFARWGRIQLSGDAMERNSLQQDLDRAKERQLSIPGNVTAGG